MKPFTRTLVRCFIALVFALTLVVLSTMSHGSTSYAATYQRAASSAHSQVSSQTTPRLVKPACSGTDRLTNFTSGRTVTFYTDWNCISLTFVDVYVLPGDGSEGFYTCYFNCFSGSFDWSHTYSSNRSYRAEAIVCWNSDNSCVAAYDNVFP